MDSPAPLPPDRRTTVATAALVLLSLSGIAIGVVGLLRDQSVTWSAPIMVGLISTLSALVQHSNQRDHAEKLAQIGDQLKRRSLLYERRIDALAGTTRALRDIIIHAQIVIRDYEIPSVYVPGYPTEDFITVTREAFDRFNANSAALYLLADNEVVEVVESISATLVEIDLIDRRRRDEGERMADERKGDPMLALGSNPEPVKHALVALRRDYARFRKLAQENLRR